MQSEIRPLTGPDGTESFRSHFPHAEKQLVSCSSRRVGLVTGLKPGLNVHEGPLIPDQCEKCDSHRWRPDPQEDGKN